MLNAPDRPRPAMPLLGRFVQNIELWLSGIGLVIVVLVFLLTPANVNPWKAVALAAVLVGSLHGVIFWVIRRRQRKVRLQAIAEIRELLFFQVNNRLSVILLKAEFPHAMQDSQENAVSQIQEAVAAISVEIERLSEDSLAKWRSQFQGLVKNSTQHHK